MKFLKFLKNLRFNGGEGGIRHERVAPLLVLRPVLSTAHTSPEINLRYLILSKRQNNNK